jgi:hypothetical protein
MFLFLRGTQVFPRYLPAYLLTCLPAYLLTCLPACLPACLELPIDEH